MTVANSHVLEVVGLSPPVVTTWMVGLFHTCWHKYSFVRGLRYRCTLCPFTRNVELDPSMVVKVSVPLLCTS